MKKEEKRIMQYTIKSISPQECATPDTLSMGFADGENHITWCSVPVVSHFTHTCRHLGNAFAMTVLAGAWIHTALHARS